MRRNTAVLAILVSLLAVAIAHAGQVIDRIVATVNGRPVLASDWDDALRFEALMQGRSLASFTASEQRGALDRLIDRELLLQQMPSDYTVPAEQVHARIAELRAQLPGASTDEGWRRALFVYGMTPPEVEERVGTQLRVLQFIDARLRPTVRVEPENIEAYYRDVLVPELKKAGAQVDPLPAVADKIEEVLMQQRMDELLTAWLSNLRNQGRIHITNGEPAPASVPGGGITERITIR